MIDSNFDLTKEVYSRLNSTNLSQIVSGELNQISSKENQSLNQKEEKINKNIIKNSERVTFLKEKDRLNSVINYRFLKDIKSRKVFHSEAQKIFSFQKYSHMKTILGHMSAEDNTMIQPVPIYVMVYSDDDKKIITGDNNGLIKIWSTITGQLIESYKVHDKPINDIIVTGKKYLISCSEDQTMAIFDLNSLSLVKIYNFDEMLIQLSEYKYNLTKSKITKIKKNQLKPKNKIIIDDDDDIEMIEEEDPEDEKDEIHDVCVICAKSGTVYIIDLDFEKQHNFDETNCKYPVKLALDKKIFDKYDVKRNKNLQITSIASNNVNGILVCGFNDGLLCLWDMNKILDETISRNRFIYDYEKFILFFNYVHSSFIPFIEFTLDSNFFLSGSTDGTILIWSIQKEVLEKIRMIEEKHFNSLNAPKPQILYPIFSIFKMTEDDDRTRCSVNVAMWTKKSNYIVAIISSKQRKKGFQSKNLLPNGLIGNNEYVNDHSNKRSSALLVYSLKQNQIIKKYNAEKGLSFDDQCFILDSHPKIEEIVLTISGVNNIVLFNFMTGQVLKSFKQINYFFSNVFQDFTAAEGKFSHKGDSFVISTFVGFISLYSIYSDNSFSTTYMNQFTSNDFSNSLTIETNLNSFFPNYVNMYNLPHIVSPPHSKYKLEATLAKKNLIKHKFGLNENEIKRYLANNLQNYNSSYEDRRLECEKEFHKYEQSLLDNMNYRLENIGMNELEEGEAIEVPSEENSYHSEGEIEEVENHSEGEEGEGDEEQIENSEDNELDREEEDLRFLNEEIAQEDFRGLGLSNYNLRRSAGYNLRNREEPEDNSIFLRSRSRNQNNTLNLNLQNNINNENENNRNNTGRYFLRGNEENENYNPNYIEDDSIDDLLDDDDENDADYRMRSHHKKRRRTNYNSAQNRNRNSPPEINLTTGYNLRQRQQNNLNGNRRPRTRIRRKLKLKGRRRNGNLSQTNTAINSANRQNNTNYFLREHVTPVSYFNSNDHNNLNDFNQNSQVISIESNLDEEYKNAMDTINRPSKHRRIIEDEDEKLEEIKK
ncbi:MAG: hypothetical protein MJ252_08105 [archaeon]|nr:hypothetical protein [archaeon]